MKACQVYWEEPSGFERRSSIFVFPVVTNSGGPWQILSGPQSRSGPQKRLKDLDGDISQFSFYSLGSLDPELGPGPPEVSLAVETTQLWVAKSAKGGSVSEEAATGEFLKGLPDLE